MLSSGLTRAALIAALSGLAVLGLVMSAGESRLRRSWRRLGLAPPTRSSPLVLPGRRAGRRGGPGRPTGPSPPGRVPAVAAAVALAAVIAAVTGAPPMLVALILAPIGWSVPGWVARRRHRAKQERLLRDFPAVLDLLAVATASGLALGQALELVCSRHAGSFATELRWALDQTAAGVRLPVALKRLSDRTGLKAVRGFASALEQALTFGSPVAQVLRLQAGAARVQRRRAIEAHIAGLPLKLSLCTVFFFLPAIMVFVILPNLLAFIHGQW